MELYPFQKEGVDKMMQFLINGETHSCYNASEMGTGKTPMALRTVLQLHSLKRTHSKKILILCPAIMRLVWEEEIPRWFPIGSEINVYLSATDTFKPFAWPKQFKPEYIWTICSYDLSHRARVLAALEKEDYDVLICDEAHYCNNRKAKRTRVALANLFNRSRYHIYLSGTPFTTRIVDGYNIFFKCNPSNFPSFHQFAEKYSFYRITPWGVNYFGARNPKELSRIIRENFYLRYTKDEVLTELPPKVFQRIALPIQYAVVPQSKDEQQQLVLDIELVRRYIEEGKHPVVPKSLAEHRRLQGEAKVDPIVDFVKNLLDQEQPVVLFAWHKNVISALETKLKDYHPKVVTGATSAEDRKNAVDCFQKGYSNLFIGNIIAGGVGITLTRSSIVVLAELDWSPATVSQAIDRVHRITQKKGVTVYYFVVQNSIDEIISTVVINRARTFNYVLNKETTDECRDGERDNNTVSENLH